MSQIVGNVPGTLQTYSTPTPRLSTSPARSAPATQHRPLCCLLQNLSPLPSSHADPANSGHGVVWSKSLLLMSVLLGLAWFVLLRSIFDISLRGMYGPTLSGYSHAGALNLALSSLDRSATGVGSISFGTNVGDAQRPNRAERRPRLPRPVHHPHRAARRRRGTCAPAPPSPARSPPRGRTHIALALRLLGTASQSIFYHPVRWPELPSRMILTILTVSLRHVGCRRTAASIAQPCAAHAGLSCSS